MQILAWMTLMLPSGGNAHPDSGSSADTLLLRDSLAFVAGPPGHFGTDPGRPPSDGSAGDTLARALELEKVTIRGTSSLQRLREGPHSVSILDARRHQHRGLGPLELLNGEAGIKIRRDGGMGSRADVSVQGLSGKRVRFFLDGIPAEYLGLGSGLQGLPLHVLDRVEVYKGAAPIELSGDALGGAVNAVTRKDAGSWIDVAYGHSSFDTHRTSVALRRSLGGGAFVEAHAFRNSSDNDYPVEVVLPDPATFRLAEKPTRVRRFHDGFDNRGANVRLGWSDLPWAEHVSAGFLGSALGKDIQHNLNMEQPYGDVRLEESSRGGFFNYRLATPSRCFALHVHGAQHRVTTIYVDTSRNTYDWTGRIIRVRDAGGEVAFDRGNHVDLATRSTLGRVGVIWRPASGWSLSVQNLVAWRERDGRDLLTRDAAERDPLTLPNSLVRNSAGLSLEKAWAEGRSTLQASLRHNAYRAEGHGRHAAEWVPGISGDGKLGAGMAARLDLGAGFLLKAAYERTTRMPDESELFGYFREVQPNLDLGPEVSHTVNAGIRRRHGGLEAEVGVFYRLVDDLIYLKTGSIWARYENLLKARFAGVEGDIRWRPAAFLDLAANATYQDIRNASDPTASGVTDSRYAGARVPNIPYLFGNLSAKASRKAPGPGPGPARLSAFWTGHYVHALYLYWALDGREDSKAIIPSQFLQDAGVTYALFESRVNLTLEALNLADVPAYDHYRIRKPGRSLGIKLHAFFGGGPRAQP